MEINEVVGRAGLGWAAVGSDPDQRITGNQSPGAAAAVSYLVQTSCRGWLQFDITF